MFKFTLVAISALMLSTVGCAAKAKTAPAPEGPAPDKVIKVPAGKRLVGLECNAPCLHLVDMANGEIIMMMVDGSKVIIKRDE